MQNDEVKECIMGCQGIIDDLRALSWRLDDLKNRIDPQEVNDVVTGLSALYEIKFKKLWDSID